MTVTDPVTGPGGRPFTAEQAVAVTERDGELLLSAAAGSGKTSVLVERFVRHVTEDGIAPSRILAITFTEKAAGEMRHRVRERLLELRARDAAREAEGAWISTIHGFCARLLRGHAVAAGLDPEFAVLDETVARALRQEAWDRAFGVWLDERGAAALDLAAAFTADRLRAAIEDVHGVLRSEGQTRPRLPVPEPEPAPDPARLLALRDAAAAGLGTGDERTSVVRAVRALERCSEVFDALDAGEVPEPALLDQMCFKPGTTAVLKGEACAAYLEEHARFAQACAAYRASRAAAELDALLAAYDDAYDAAKRARSGLDFDDLELLARDLLRDVPAVRAATQERFLRVMVDEFQDSSPRQVELFDLVAGEDRAMFMVGDELQSIYGFRHADVEVFRSRRAALEPRGATAALTMNFRSRAPVLEAVNAAFAERFGEAMRPLVAGRGDAHDGAPDVEILLTDTEGWDDVDLGSLPRAQPWRQAEARLLAQRIADLVRDEGVRPEDVVVLLRSATDLPVYERALEEAGLQTLAAGGRGYWARQVVRDLCAWLAALANPRDEQQLYGVLASPLVGLSTDALALVAQAGTGRAWALIDAAFGPGGAGEGAERVAAAAGSDPGAAGPESPDAPRPVPGGRRGSCPDSGASGGGDALRDLAARLPGLLAEPDRERLAAFRARFVRERELMSRLPLDELLRRAIEASDYDLHVLRLPGGPRRLANIHKLLRLAADHERVHGRDVRGLVDRAAAELEAEAREDDAPVELGDAKAVRLMTIHAAKGLEFPVVAVADLGRRPAADTPPVLVRGGRLGIRLPSVSGGREDGLDYAALREERRKAEAAEEDRVLYVALTRARERLILSGALRLDPWPDATRNGAAPIAWLAPAILGTTPRPDGGDGAVAAPDGRPVRCVVSTPATVGSVLRRESLAPAGAKLPPAPPPPARGPLPAPAPPPQPVRALSYSALALWKRCGYRFYLQRVLGLPEEDDARRPATPVRTADGGLDARVRGWLAHEALERGGDPRALVAETAERHGIELSAGELDDISGLVDAFSTTELAARLARAGRVRREHTFSFAIGATMFTGIVDVLAVEEDGTALIVDYKTDRLDPAASPADVVARDYAVQQRLYALAALRAGFAGVEVAYAFLERPREPVAAVYTQADVPRLEEELLALAEGVFAGRYEVAREPHIGLCAGCPGRRALCSHPEELTGREPPPVGS